MFRAQEIPINCLYAGGPPPMRWLMWNMSFHTAHHCFPGVPFHALPALRGEIVAGLGHGVPTSGYLQAQRNILNFMIAQRRAPA